MLAGEVGVVYASAHKPPKDPLLREVSFFDEKREVKTPLARQIIDSFTDQLRSFPTIRPLPVELDGVVVRREFETTLPAHHRAFVAHNLFTSARAHFANTNKFARLAFDVPPDIFRCTHQLPLRANCACNIYTIHDLVPLRVPLTTLDNKRQMFRLLKRIAK